jgi:hypothetical protein
MCVFSNDGVRLPLGNVTAVKKNLKRWSRRNVKRNSIIHKSSRAWKTLLAAPPQQRIDTYVAERTAIRKSKHYYEDKARRNGGVQLLNHGTQASYKRAYKLQYNTKSHNHEVSSAMTMPPLHVAKQALDIIKTNATMEDGKDYITGSVAFKEECLLGLFCTLFCLH